jgi:hypothetical protein
VVHRVKIDETDTGDIVRKVQSAFDALGQAAGKDVLCDITGGTKVMTATLAGIAAVNGWRQCYVESNWVRDRKGSYNERIVEVTSAFEHLGGWERGVAWRLASLGHFEGASRALARSLRESVASAADYRQLKRFSAAKAYRKADLDRVRLLAPRIAHAAGRALKKETMDVLQRGPFEGFYYWVAVCLLAEGQPLAASAALAMIGTRCAPAELRQQLKALRRERAADWKLQVWKRVEDLLGRAFSKEVARLG